MKSFWIVTLLYSTLAMALISRAHSAAQWAVTDDTGATVPLAAPAQRIVSLAPGATEMLFAAGAGARIVATVAGADEPAAARAIPRIGDANALQYERLKALKPDVIVAWKDMTNTLVIESLAKLELKVYYVSVRTLEDIPRSVRRLGALAGTTAAAESSARSLERRIAALPTAKASLAAAGQPGRPASPLPVFYMIWDVPLYTVGGRHVMADAIARCGGRNLYDDIDFPAPIVEFEDIKKRDPALILMAAPPITARDWRERWDRFPSVKAVKNRQITSFSDPRLTRQGPSAIDAVPELCRVIAAARTSSTR